MLYGLCITSILPQLTVSATLMSFTISKLLLDVASVMAYVIVYSPVGSGWSRVSVIGMYASVALLCELRGSPKSAGIGSVNGLPWLSEMPMVAVKLNEYNMLPSSSTPSLNPYPIGSTYSTIERTSGLKMLDGRSSYTPYP